MSVIGSNVLAGASGGGAAGYEIERSLRFNSADSAYLDRTPSSEGNRKTWTWSGWVKRSELGTLRGVFSAGTSASNYTSLYFQNDQLKLEDYTGAGIIATSAVFRDPSAWYHLVVSVDTTQVTASDRVKFYINGELQVTTGSWAQNTDTRVNYTNGHRIGTVYPNGSTHSFDGYLAEVHFIDGQQLAPTDFGKFDDNNVWQPKAYSGTYGTNGFHLDFSDNSSNAALGTDSSGNSNDWTVNNISALDYTSSLLNVDISTSLELYVTQVGSGESVFVNGIDVTSQITVDSFSAITGVGTTLNSVKTTSNGAGTAYYALNAIKANGSWLIDTGTANPPTPNIIRDWSTDYLESEPFSTRPITRAFDGNLGSYTQGFVGQTGGSLNSSIDSLIDTPTNYTADSGNNGGNYATWNPLAKGSNTTLSNGNLDMSSGASWQSVVGTFGATSGKWYWEQTMTTNQYSYTGICNQKFTDVNGLFPGKTVNSWSYLTSSGLAKNDQGGASQLAVTLTAMPSGGGTLGFALDLDNQKLWFALNGTWMGSGSPNPATGTAAAFTNLVSGDTYFPCADVNGTSATFNFGQRSFAYTPPTGFKSLCTTNLPDPDPAIADGSKAMDATLYTGNGSTQTISGLNFSPDFVWVKNRDQADNHKLIDTVRGATNELESNTTDDEDANADGLTAFNSDGFALGADVEYNTNSEAYVAWSWDGGTSTVTNTDGSITSSVRANASAGFSIVSYTGSSSAATVGHGLNAAPGMIIVKDRDSSSWNWQVAHSGIGADDTLILNATAAADDYNAWNNTRPTSSVFSLSGGIPGVSTDGSAHIAYCFAPVEGYSAFGSYTGNNSTDGPFVYTGFRPRWILIKLAVGSTYPWEIYDTARSEYNVINATLAPNTATSESAQPYPGLIDATSNGFKIRSANATSYINYINGTYIYAAFAEHPFKTARAR